MACWGGAWLIAGDINTQFAGFPKEWLKAAKATIKELEVPKAASGRTLSFAIVNEHFEPVIKSIKAWGWPMRPHTPIEIPID